MPTVLSELSKNLRRSAGGIAKKKKKKNSATGKVWRPSEEVNGEKLTVIKSPTMARKKVERRREEGEGTAAAAATIPLNYPVTRGEQYAGIHGGLSSGYERNDRGQSTFVQGGSYEKLRRCNNACSAGSTTLKTRPCANESRKGDVSPDFCQKRCSPFARTKLHVQ